MHRRTLALFALITWPALAQFTDLTAPGQGADLYYALHYPRPIPGALESSPDGPIYKVGSVPATLFASFPPPVFPPNNIFSTNTVWFLSAYYLVSHPQFSFDGSVFAFTGKRVCLGGKGCISVTTTQTTVQGVPGQGALTFDGRGWLSGNGRYLLLQPEQSVAGSQRPVWVDLQTSQRQTVSASVSFDHRDSNGRVLADDGTAVFTGCAPISLCIFRAGELIPSPHDGAEPVIDAAGQTVIYTSTAAIGSSSQYLRVFNIVTKRDAVFVQPNGDTYSPAISADGKRVMFLSTAQWGTSNPPGVTQLYAINLNGSGFQQLTSGSEPTGVQQYAMSDDGQVAWYLSGDGKLVKLDLSSGQPVRTVFSAAAVDLSGTLVPGSAVTLSGVGLRDAADTKVTVNGIPAPLLSVAPGGIVFQVPWEIPAGRPAALQVVTNAGTATEATAQGTTTPVVSRPALIPACAAVSCDLGGAAIHQDWTSYVTPELPALAGEVLHFYGTGFGPVQPAATTGAASPANPPAVVPRLPACTSDPGGPTTVLYLGLAPGLVGYYQMDVQLPAAFLSVHPTENRTYDQFYIDCGPGAISAFAIKAKP